MWMVVGRNSEAPGHRVLEAIGAHKAGSQRASEMAAEVGVRNANAFEGATNLIADRFTQPFGRFTALSNEVLPASPPWRPAAIED